MDYDLKKVKAPRLRGLGLRMFTGLIENAFFRTILLPGLLKNIGVIAFRKQVSKAAPTNVPLVRSREPQVPTPPPHKVVEAVAAEEGKSSRSLFRFASITDYAQAYRDRTISPKEVGERIIAAIESSNDSGRPLRAIIKSEAEDIRRQAAESEERLAQGRPRSILEGVPVAIKDELEMPPYTTQVGTRFLGQESAEDDATAVSRLRAAGALMIGNHGLLRALPIDLILTQRFESIDKINGLKIPVLMIHGTADSNILPSMTEQLYAAAPKPKELLLIEGAGHANSGSIGLVKYHKKITEFVMRYKNGPKNPDAS